MDWMKLLKMYLKVITYENVVSIHMEELWESGGLLRAL
jgi:hypothetical protein